MENNTGDVRKLLMIELTVTRYMMVLHTFLTLSINTGLIESLNLAEIAGSNPAGSMDASLLCCALPGRSPCVGLITRPEESCRVWCVRVLS
jgi:hypothetical protein